MRRILLKAIIHRATVNEANVDYEESITIDENLTGAAGILPFEQVHTHNVTNGNSFQTYAMSGKRASRAIGMNGAATHQANKDDVLLIASYSLLDDEIILHQPKLPYVDKNNREKSEKTAGY